MNIIELMKEKHYDIPEDITISDLRELGECITDNMSVGGILGCIEVLYEEALGEEE